MRSTDRLTSCNTVGNRIAPPFTSIVKYDLNGPVIKWRIGFGDDPALAALRSCRLAMNGFPYQAHMFEQN